MIGLLLILHGLLTLAQSEIDVDIAQQNGEPQVTFTWTHIPCYNNFVKMYPNQYIIRVNESDKFFEYSVNYKFPWLYRGRLEQLFPHPLKPWRLYTVQIDGKCPSLWAAYYRLAGKRDFVIAQKELQPLVKVTVEPGDHSALVKWSDESDSESAATNVSIECCKKAMNGTLYGCQLFAGINKTKEQFELTNLTPGVDYTALLRLQLRYNKVAYSTPAVSATFQVNPPCPGQYPPAEINVDVKHVKDTTLAIICLSVNATEFSGINRTLWGFAVRLEHRHGQLIKETRSVSPTVTIEDLAPLSYLRVRVHALYTHNEDVIWSQESENNFTTGAGEIAKPKIERMMPISDKDVLVEWSHTPKDSGELVYVVHYQNGKDLKNKTVHMFTHYTVLKGLLPESSYEVFVSASIDFDGKLYTNGSDLQQVTLPPEGALTPTWTNESPNATSEGIQLSWTHPHKADLPMNPFICTQIIDVCVTEDRCKHEIGIKPDETRALSPFFEFENNIVTVAIDCRYKEEIIRRNSTPTQIFGGFAPSPPIGLTVKTNGSNVCITIEPNQYDVRFASGYEIRWTSDDTTESAEWPSDRIYVNSDSYKIAMLEPDTMYTISVATFAISSDGKRTYEYMGKPVLTKVVTELPVPPKVENLTVLIQDYTGLLKIDWNKPNYSWTELEYQVNVTCGTENNTEQSIRPPEWTKETMIRAKFQAKAGDTCTVAVRAANFLPNAGGVVIKQGEADTKDVTYHGTPPPKAIAMVKRYQNALRLQGEGPVTRKHIPFGYKLAKQDPGPVENLRAQVVKQRIRIDWDPPVKSRGPIHGYFIAVEDLEDKTTEYFNAPKDAPWIEVDAAKEHAWYRIDVKAINVARTKETLSGEVSSIFKATGGENPPPVNITSITQKSDGVGLSWAHANVEDFNIKCFRLTVTQRKTQTALGVATYPDDDKRQATTSPEPPKPSPEDGEQSIFFTEVAHASRDGLKPYMNYTITLAACCEETKCGRERTILYTTAPSHPSKPQSFVYNERESNNVTVSWKPPEYPAGPLDGYEIAAAKKGTSPEHWRDLNGRATRFTFDNLEDGTEYIVYLKAYNNDPNNDNIDDRTRMLTSDVVKIEVFTVAASSTVLWQVIMAIMVFLGLAVLGYVTYVKRIRIPSDDSRQLLRTHRRTNPSKQTDIDLESVHESVLE